MTTDQLERFHKLFPIACDDPDQLHAWLTSFLGLRVPRIPVCADHDAPFDYVWHAYREPARDQVIWAPRGGGKTRLAAAVTLLDMIHKPGVAVRILGGSLDQSLRMWEHLIADVERVVPHMLRHPTRGSSRRIELSNGSTCAVLAQSQRAVRGLRVQKLRCDEVELFDPDIWQAAQLVTRSEGAANATVEALSTLHAPHGLMSKIVDRAREVGMPVTRWCLLDVLERCPPQRDCEACALWDECRGVAKTRCEGFVKIADAIAIKRRTSGETWDAEMLCRRPSVRGCVFPSFDPAVHLRESIERGARAELCLGVDFGFAAPFVCLWIERHDDGSSFVIDEYVQPGQTIDAHIDVIRSRHWGPVSRLMCDPAGAGRSDQTAASNVQVLRSAGFIVRHRKSLIIDGIERIRAALRSGSGEATLFIHPRCARLIRALQAYRYPETGSELPLKDGEHDHLIDALRYYFVNVDARETSARSY